MGNVESSAGAGAGNELEHTRRSNVSNAEQAARNRGSDVVFVKQKSSVPHGVGGEGVSRGGGGGGGGSSSSSAPKAVITTAPEPAAAVSAPPSSSSSSTAPSSTASSTAEVPSSIAEAPSTSAEAPSSAAAITSSGGSTSSSSLDEIRRLLAIVDELEGELRRKRSQLSSLQMQMQGVLQDNKERLRLQEETLAQQLHEQTAEAKARYSEALNALNLQRDAELQASIKHVSTVQLEERRCMSREDARSFVFRELEEAWRITLQDLQVKHDRDMQAHMAVANETHEKLFQDQMGKYDAEFRQAQEAVEESKRERRKRSSIFSFLSPGTKKSRRDDDDDDDDDSDDE